MKKILAVSTDEQLLTQLKTGLETNGFEVQTIANHEHLFTRITGIDPYILIIDFIMENDNAAALCHRLKSDPASKDLHIILVSEFPQMEQFAAKFGSFSMVRKPVDIRDILTSISDAAND
ncbi:Response regulator receiver domain-containing protein [Mucilaginibacter lappiensis]|uniref:CheY-like chemotaxis protein n=1 Tax=Mucilaginibacter lappiensis TaxID=354630 RepID=A0ABR6PD76_9SPHI|nr:response regulator [Mucilaginibacter lappiensis]MBB6107710.1 CheY-like chemotaxis protein [Mucilaginibacter lappiensis]SIP99598.1 Response regulator receiver domain-containing protein [Mucilaginibacter lappiensis]